MINKIMSLVGKKKRYQRLIEGLSDYGEKRKGKPFEVVFGNLCDCIRYEGNMILSENNPLKAYYFRIKNGKLKWFTESQLCNTYDDLIRFLNKNIDKLACKYKKGNSNNQNKRNEYYSELAEQHGLLGLFGEKGDFYGGRSFNNFNHYLLFSSEHDPAINRAHNLLALKKDRFWINQSSKSSIGFGSILYAEFEDKEKK